MTQLLTWDKIQNEWQSLKVQPLDETNLESYIQELSRLEAQVYQDFSTLERDYFAQPGNVDAQQKFVKFHREVYGPSSVMVRECGERLAKWMKYLPNEWRYALKSLTTVSKFNDDTQNLIRESEALASNFNMIESEIVYKYFDNDGDMGVDLISQNRELRYKAHLGYLNSYDIVADRMANLFQELHKIRNMAAKESGFANYSAFVWETGYFLERDYDQSDVIEVRRLVKKYVCPLLIHIRQERKNMLGLDTLRPWDIYVSYSNIPSVLKAKDADQALDAAAGFISKLSPSMFAIYKQHRSAGQYLVVDSTSPYVKSYSNFLPNENISWMTSWYSGSASTIFSMIHEIGHTIHRSMMPHEALFRQKFPAMEFSEFAAQFLEAKSVNYLNEFYEKFDKNYLTIQFIERALSTTIRRAMLDEYQDILYRLDDINREVLDTVYANLLQEYPDGVKIDDLNQSPSGDWMDWHLFARPYYGIEYPIAWIGVAQVFQKQRDNAVEEIFTRCQDASTRQMFSDLQVQLIPSDETMREVANWLEKLIDDLTFHTKK